MAKSDNSELTNDLVMTHLGELKQGVEQLQHKLGQMAEEQQEQSRMLLELKAHLEQKGPALAG